MVVTRRRSRSNASLLGGNNDDDTGSFISARGSAPPPPPPPPPPLPPPPPQELLGASGPTADPQQHQQPDNGVSEEAAVHHLQDMSTIPEEVEVHNNNNSNANDGEEDHITEGNSNIFVETNNNATATQQAAAPQPPPIQYLQVRVPPPTQSSLRPSRIHRRHHHQQPTNNNAPNTLHNKRRSKIRKSSSPSSNINEVGVIVRILIPPNGFASERQLADCLSQAGAPVDVAQMQNQQQHDDFDDEYSVDEFYLDDGRETINVAGMFRESDHVFVPLSVIYSEPTLFVGEVLCLKRPPPIPKRPHFRPTPNNTKRRSIFITFLELLGIAVVAAASWYTYDAAQYVDWEDVLDESLYKLERCFFTIINFPFWLFDLLIEFPLREIYRHGPSVLGWEGEPLPRICARITYHGDESFWSRNIDECERIYEAKEAAAMQVRKPIVVGFLILVLFYMVKAIVEARALRRRERVDPNMVETYRAIQMLTRQLRRAVNTR